MYIQHVCVCTYIYIVLYKYTSCTAREVNICESCSEYMLRYSVPKSKFRLGCVTPSLVCCPTREQASNG